MKLSVGKVKFPIEFDNGDKGEVWFNPTDPNIMTRFSEMQTNIAKKIEALESEGVDLDNDGNVMLPETVDYDELSDDQKELLSKKIDLMTNLLTETNGIICDEIDRALNGDISSVIFKHCSPLAIVNGEYFVVQVLESFAIEIQKHIKKANASIEKKMSKHIQKYQKK